MTTTGRPGKAPASQRARAAQSQATCPPADQDHNHQDIGVDDISVYVEAADQATLRRILRAVLDHLDLLNQIAAASAALGQSSKDQAYGSYAAAVQAPGPPGSTGPASQGLAADFAEAYFTHLGFVCGAAHIGYCVQSVTAAIACGLGLAGRPPGDRELQDPGPGT